MQICCTNPIKGTPPARHLSGKSPPYRRKTRQTTKSGHRQGHSFYRIFYLPKTEISILNTIIAKATTEDNYGHLIKAQLAKYHACRLFDDEKAVATVEEIKQKEAQTKNKALRAVYDCALGLIYQDLAQSNEEADTLSRPYFRKSMSDPDELARHKTTELAPAFIPGLDSRIFNNDLLHVVCRRLCYAS